MENQSDLLFLGYAISGIKLIWALVVPVIIYLIYRKIRSMTPKWIKYSLVAVAIISLQNAVPVMLPRILNVAHYGIVMLISNILNTTGPILLLAVVYGMASTLSQKAPPTVQMNNHDDH
jgi:hypothetical protein